MVNAWGLFKRIGQKKYDQLKDSYQTGATVRIDKDLPLGVRINGMVEIPEVDFILGGSDLKIKHPGTSNSVLSYGTFPVGDSIVNRFYLDAPEQPYVLQVVVDAKKMVEECKLFMPYDDSLSTKVRRLGFLACRRGRVHRTECLSDQRRYAI